MGSAGTRCDTPDTLPTTTDDRARRPHEVGLSPPIGRQQASYRRSTTPLSVEPVINDLLSPWRTNRLPRAIGLLATDLVLPWIPFALTIALVATSLGLAVTYPLATPFIGLLFVVAAAFGKLERSRVHAHTGADIGDPGHPRTTGSWWHRIRTLLASKSRWKEVAYFLTTPIWATALGVFTFCLWGASIFLVTLPVVAGRFPSGSAELGLFNVGPGLSAFAAGALGLVCLVVVAPWCTLGFAAARREVAAALLGPGQDEALRRRVRSLETSRSAAVDAAEKERRRIERDLHDGAQQRLVALAMDLGRAKERFETDPDGARQIIESAHDEAKAALSELRDLVRGIHPRSSPTGASTPPSAPWWHVAPCRSPSTSPSPTDLPLQSRAPRTSW